MKEQLDFALTAIHKVFKQHGLLNNHLVILITKPREPQTLGFCFCNSEMDKNQGNQPPFRQKLEGKKTKYEVIGVHINDKIKCLDTMIRDIQSHQTYWIQNDKS